MKCYTCRKWMTRFSSLQTSISEFLVVNKLSNVISQTILCFKGSKGQFCCLPFPWFSVTSDLSSSWQKWLKCRNKKEEGKQWLTTRRKHVWTTAIITFEEHVWPQSLDWVRVWAMITLLQPSIRGQLIKDERRRGCGGLRVSLQIIQRTKQPSAVSASYLWAVPLPPLHAHTYLSSKLFLNQLCFSRWEG